MRRGVGGAVALATTAVVAVTLSACGGETPETRTVVVTQPAPPEQTANPKPEARAKRPRRFKNCDANIRAKIGTTSCPFAQNVFYEFWQATNAGDDAVTAYSPVTEQDYDMVCRTGSTVVCAGGDASEVRFRMSAIDAYDEAQAHAYACGHQVDALDVSGCPDYEDPAAFAAASSGGDTGSDRRGGDCDPNYAGACLNPNSYDYDCDGGSGDGPDYTGYLEVVGEDVYDLDRDRDGIACDT